MSEYLRPRALAAALLAVLALALTSAGCGGSDGDDGHDGNAREARALLEDTFAKDVESGELELKVKAAVEGVKSLEEPLEVTVKGPFKSNGKKKLPVLDWDIAFDGAGQKLSGGLVATRDNAFVELQGQAYEVGEKTFARLAREVTKAQPNRPTSPGKLGMDPASWLEDPKVENGEPIGGDDTREVTGSVNVRKVVRDVADLFKSPAVRRQLERQGQGSAAVPEPTNADLKEIEDAIEDADVELSVDENDVLRRFVTDVRFDVPREGNAKDVKGKFTLTYVLRKVGTDRVIRAPSNPRPLSELLGGFGLGAPGSPRD